MDQAAARWNKLCWRAVRSPPIAWLAAGPWARAHGIEDAAPIGANSQGAGRLYVRANLAPVLLRVSQSPWFDLSFDFCNLLEPHWQSTHR